jgi:hypothetical protein
MVIVDLLPSGPGYFIVYIAVNILKIPGGSLVAGFKRFFGKG